MRKNHSNSISILRADILLMLFVFVFLITACNGEGNSTDGDSDFDTIENDLEKELEQEAEQDISTDGDKDIELEKTEISDGDLDDDLESEADNESMDQDFETDIDLDQDQDQETDIEDKTEIEIEEEDGDEDEDVVESENGDVEIDKCEGIDYDDGNFCNGVETCDPATGNKIDGETPCGDGETCDEGTNQCNDTDGCSLENNPCDTNASCTDNPAPQTGASCECNEGYSGDGESCDIFTPPTFTKDSFVYGPNKPNITLELSSVSEGTKAIRIYHNESYTDYALTDFPLTLAGDAGSYTVYGLDDATTPNETDEGKLFTVVFDDVAPDVPEVTTNGGENTNIHQDDFTLEGNCTSDTYSMWVKIDDEEMTELEGFEPLSGNWTYNGVNPTVFTGHDYTFYSEDEAGNLNDEGDMIHVSRAP